MSYTANHKVVKCAHFFKKQYILQRERTPPSLLYSEGRGVVSSSAFLSSEFYDLLYSALFSHFEKFGGNSPNEDHVPHKPLCNTNQGWG